MSLASVTFSPVSAVAWNEGIGLFGAAPAHVAGNRAHAVEVTTHETNAEVDLMNRMPSCACRVCAYCCFFSADDGSIAAVP